MRIGTLGLPEILIILGLIVLLFGGRKLPRLGHAMGESLRKPFRQAKWVWTSLTGSEEDTIAAEEAYGREYAREFSAQYPGTPSGAHQTLILAIGAKLARNAGGQRKFSFQVIRESAPNAFALPGGFVFITNSIIELCESNEEEIAFLLAHEMSHILQGHARERLMSRTILRAVTARAAAAGPILQKMLGEGYSREQELEADCEAVRITRAAGFDSRAGLKSLGRLAQFSKGKSGMGEYFSSHPPIPDRLRELERQMTA